MADQLGRRHIVLGHLARQEQAQTHVGHLHPQQSEGGRIGILPVDPRT
jgi:hypothetical protein